MNSKMIFFKITLLVCIPVFLAYGDEADHWGSEIDWGIHPAPFERSGMAGWQFLKIQTDARSAAVGGVITPLSRGDASFALTNPASTADVNNLSASFTQMSYVADISYMSGAVVKNMGNLGVFGVNFVYLDYGDMNRTSITSGIDDFGFATGQIDIDYGAGTFSGGNLALGLSYGRKVTDRLEVGGNLRYISETLDNEGDITTTNWALDVATIYYTGIRSLRLAMVGKNFGPDSEFTEFEEQVQIAPVDVRMPMVFALGLAYDILESSDSSPHLLTIATEFTHPNDGPEKLNFGAEYTFNELVALRAGYRYNYDEFGLSLGAGLNLHTRQYGLKINYAFIDTETFDSLHMFSIGLNMD